MTSLQESLNRHVQALEACRKCPLMRSTPVSGGPVRSRVMLIGQAPGIKEPLFRRPFAWTAGKTMFGWFQHGLGVDERTFRDTVYMAAVCRCFPGRVPAKGGDRVPNRDEVANCSTWMAAEFALLRPELVVCVGKLALGQFMRPVPPLNDVIGRIIPAERWGYRFELAPLPHPSGASPWHRLEPGKTLLRQALEQIGGHLAWKGRVRF